MKLDWNINYQIISNYLYWEQTFLIFQIPTHQGMVQMKLDLHDTRAKYLVLLDTQKFIQAWRTSKNDERFPNYHLGNAELWRSDRDFSYTASAFNRSLEQPVYIATEISCDGDDSDFNINFNNGFTRTIWLLANEAEYIPIATQNLKLAEKFQKNIGRDGCPIYARANLYEQWWQQNQHLFPQVPDDELEKYLQSKNETDLDISDFSQ